jgi:hypothetical protein
MGEQLTVEDILHDIERRGWAFWPEHKAVRLSGDGVQFRCRIWVVGGEGTDLAVGVGKSYVSAIRAAYAIAIAVGDERF